MRKRLKRMVHPALDRLLRPFTFRKHYTNPMEDHLHADDPRTI